MNDTEQGSNLPDDFAWMRDAAGNGDEEALQMAQPGQPVVPEMANPAAQPVTEKPEGEKPGHAAQMRPHIEQLEGELQSWNDFAKPYGGLEGVRQFSPVIEALYEADDSARVDKLLAAMQGILPDGDLQGLRQRVVNDPAFLGTFADQNEEGLLDYFIQTRGDTLREKLGIAGAPTALDGDDFEDDGDEPLQQQLAAAGQQNPEIAALQQQIQQLQQQLSGQQQQDAQTSAQQIASQVGEAVFGQAVNDSFEPLQVGGWQDAELTRAYQIAQTEFERDPQAVAAFKLANQFHGKPAFEGHVARARDIFANKLAEAVKMVDAVRAQQRTEAAPKPLERQELSSDKPSMDTADPDQKSFFDDPDAFAKMVQNKMRAQGRL